MPFQGKPAASMTFSVRDESGSPSTFSTSVPSSTLSDVVQAAAGVMRGLVANLTTCAITGQNLTYTQIDNTPEAPEDGSRVERKGVFEFLTAVGKIFTIEIPGIADACVLETGQIDRTNAAVLAFVGAVIAADSVYSDSNGERLTSLHAAYERYSKTTKTQLPSRR